jgi:hypothetical protein
MIDPIQRKRTPAAERRAPSGAWVTRHEPLLARDETSGAARDLLTCASALCNPSPDVCAAAPPAAEDRRLRIVVAAMMNGNALFHRWLSARRRATSPAYRGKARTGWFA